MYVYVYSNKECDKTMIPPLPWHCLRAECMPRPPGIPLAFHRKLLPGVSRLPRHSRGRSLGGVPCGAADVPACCCCLIRSSASMVMPCELHVARNETALLWCRKILPHHVSLDEGVRGWMVAHTIVLVAGGVVEIPWYILSLLHPMLTHIFTVLVFRVISFIYAFNPSFYPSPLRLSGLFPKNINY